MPMLQSSESRRDERARDRSTTGQHETGGRFPSGKRARLAVSRGAVLSSARLRRRDDGSADRASGGGRRIARGPARMTGSTPEGGPKQARPRARLDVLLLLGAAGALIFQLGVPPIVGLADDGDFARLMGPVGLQYPVREYDRMYWNYVTPVYSIVRPFWKSRYMSTERALVAFTRFVAADVFGSRRYDIRLLGAVHVVIFLGALALMLAALRSLPLAARAAIGIALVVIFSDVSYAAPFNSFYSQTASLLAFLLAAGMAGNALATPGPRRFRFVLGYWLAAAMLVLSKPQESVLAPILALLGVFLAAPATRRAKAAGAAAAAALCAAACFYYASTPLPLSRAGRYFALFDEILPNSPDPARDLRELGLPADWVRHANTTPYDHATVMSDEEFRGRFEAGFGTRQLLGFYASHPKRLASLLRRGCAAALVTRPQPLGNFAEAPGVPPGAKSRAFALWSDAKAGLRKQGVWLLPLVLAGNVAGGLAGFFLGATRLRRRVFLATAVLAAMAALEFGVVMLAQGRIDLDRHLYVFQAMLDLSFLIGVAGSAGIAAGTARRIRRSRAR